MNIRTEFEMAVQQLWPQARIDSPSVSCYFHGMALLATYIGDMETASDAQLLCVIVRTLPHLPRRVA